MLRIGKGIFLFKNAGIGITRKQTWRMMTEVHGCWMKEHMRVVGVEKEDTEYKLRWRQMIHSANL